MTGRTELNPAGWNRIATIFERACEAIDGERAALLDQLCGSDRTIRTEVEEMLAAHDGRVELLAERRLVPDCIDTPAPNDVLDAGVRVGPYRVLSLVGRGGMGDVYRAERADGAYRQIVALKILRPGYRTAEMIRRFRVEREALARLVHPGIAAILDGGTLDDGRPYIVLQFVEGLPITEHCDRQQLDVRGRLALFLHVARTVQFAHTRLVVHRDIKPSNILVESDGTPRLLDFGIAKLLDVASDSSLALETRPEQRLLTLSHAAPEQVRGESPTTSTDVYALGVLLFELLTARRPFDANGRSTWSLERAVLEEAPPPPSAVVQSPAIARGLRGDLDRIVLMALRKEPDRRYSSAAQLAEDVERYLGGRPVTAQSDSLRYRASKFVARNRAIVAAASVLGLLLVAFAATSTVQARRIARERDRAERERGTAESVIGILTGLFERANPNKYPGGDTLRVTALLDDAERHVGTLTQDPTRQAALLRAVGQMRRARGEYPRAIALAGRAAELRRVAYGPLDLEAARIRHEVALMRVDYEGAAAARPSLLASLAEFRRLEPRESEDVRSAVSDMLMAARDSIESRSLLNELLELERRAPSGDPIAIANRLDARAVDRYGAGDYAEAASLWQASVDLLTKHLPPEHEDVRTERRNLALALLQVPQVARAESLQRAEVEIADRVPGPGVTRGQAHEALALTFVAEGRADSAEQQERIALREFRQGAAPGHTRIWSAARNLGIIIGARGRIAEGLAYMDTSIAIARAGPDGDRSAGYLIAQTVPFLIQLARLTDAARAIDTAERLIGDGPSITAAHRADVDRYAGLVALATGDGPMAVKRFGDAVDLAERRTKPATSPELDSCLLGVALVRAGRAEQARPLLDAPCSRYESHGLPNSLIVAWVDSARTQLRDAASRAATRARK